MQVAVSARSLVLSDTKGVVARVGLEDPVNDVLGLLREDGVDGGVVRHWARYGRFWGPITIDPNDTERTDRILAALEAVTSSQAPATFEGGARAAQRGHLDPAIAEHLAQVRYRPGSDPDELPDHDFVALTAWALDQVMRRYQFTVRKCRMCKAPWIATARAPRECERPAPGQYRSCREEARRRRLAGKTGYGAYRREYKRIEQARRRGTVAEEDWQQWKHLNTPDSWTPFDNWKRAWDSFISQTDGDAAWESYISQEINRARGD